MAQKRTRGKPDQPSDASVSPSTRVAEATTEGKEEEVYSGATPSQVEALAPSDACTDTRTALPSAVWFDRLKRVRRFLPKRTYDWALGRVSRRYGDEWAWTNSDDKWNDRETPPEGERLTWHAVWLVEAYLPSNIPGLIEGLERFGWLRDGDDESIGAFISKCRLSPGGGGLMHLPMLRPPTAKGFFPGYLNRELPHGVELVTGQIQIQTYSLTVLIAGFRFDDSVSDEVDAALRRRY